MDGFAELDRSQKAEADSNRSSKSDLDGKDNSDGQRQPCDEALSIRVADTPVGKGVFATRAFPADAIIGEIDGELIVDSDYGSDYCMWLGDDWHLEPNAPFRFLNHHCVANCDWDCFLEEDESGVEREVVYLFATREIQAGEELTLDYSWSADHAIPCKCGSADCRGWIVCPTELWLLRANV